MPLYCTSCKWNDEDDIFTPSKDVYVLCYECQQKERDNQC